MPSIANSIPTPDTPPNSDNNIEKNKLILPILELIIERAFIVALPPGKAFLLPYNILGILKSICLSSILFYEIPFLNANFLY